MEAWKNDPNKRAIAIVRRSGYNQKENTSGDTQDREIRAYALRHGLELIKVESIIETAFNRDDRKLYRAHMKFALSQGIKHVLFYVGSREARNLTDNEINEELIRADKLVIHHVNDGKVYDKSSPDSDFLNRDVIAAVNKHSSRENGTKMKAAYVTKALNGHWPYRHTPLGYIHFKDKDAYGNPIKGTARLIRDTNERNVRLVQREFQLRSEGYTLDEIRKKNIDDGFVPVGTFKNYSRHGIEERLKNPLYWGHFFLTNDPTEYKGVHELIIDPKILKTVQGINSGQTVKRKTVDGDGVFRGMLTCNHPECQRAITYERKEKWLKSTGQGKVYHLYRCSNSRKVHDKKVYVSEDKIWQQFEPAVEALTISEEFARDIADALNETHDKQNQAIRKQMEGFRSSLRDLELREDRAYQDFTDAVLDKEAYQRQIARVRDERKHYENEIERLTLTINDEAMVSVQKVIELAINAKALYKSMDAENRLKYVKNVCSNPTLDGLTALHS